MQYRNKRTGAVIETPCAVTGENWECVEEKAPAAPKAQEAQPAKPRASRKKATVK